MANNFEKKVFIKYNPYRVTTEVLIDDKPVKRNSRLNVTDKRLQEWIDDLPEILLEECSTRDFDITFQGTILDYEDLDSIAKEARKQGINISLKHIPTKEVKDKETAIADLFAEIQNGPFDELKQQDVVKAFRLAQSSDFEVNVVATMSAGKSTLINSLLGQRLMPAKQEACTATITEIKDTDASCFSAKVYDKQGGLIESQAELTYEIMDRLNSNPNVSKIRVEGNIPFVTAEDVALVLVDTPGPNNSRDPEHKAATFRMLSESSKTVVLYIMNATQLAVDDDNSLIHHVADSMKVGGKQSRDRFIFVVNKLDDYKKNEDSIEKALTKVRDYLADHGIENPNIYPASALTALNIRTILANSDDDDDDDVYEAKGKVRKFNRNEEMHFENYAPLPASAKGNIANRLQQAIDTDNQNEQALIHSGIIPVEEAIRMYVRKYAKTAKIKNIVDTFLKKLESAKSFETAKEQIASNVSEQEAVIRKITDIEAKLKNGEEAKKFKNTVDQIDYDAEIKEVADSILKKAQEKITNQLRDADRKMSAVDAEELCHSFRRFAENLQADVCVKLEELIQSNVQKNANDLLMAYKKKLADLVQEVSIEEIHINPFEIMEGDIPDGIDRIISSSTNVETVKVGEKYVKNTDKKWYKPWTWFDEKGWYEDVTEEREYVDGRILAERFFTPIEENLRENKDAAVKYAKNQVKEIKTIFAQKFDELDELLESKLAELKKCASDKETVERQLKESRARLEWLESIQDKVNGILDI